MHHFFYSPPSLRDLFTGSSGSSGISKSTTNSTVGVDRFCFWGLSIRRLYSTRHPAHTHCDKDESISRWTLWWPRYLTTFIVKSAFHTRYLTPTVLGIPSSPSSHVTQKNSWPNPCYPCRGTPPTTYEQLTNNLQTTYEHFVSKYVRCWGHFYK